jgi:dimethylhistidine N-methyltransferase
VRAGLTRPGQKELPSKYLYDALGSALFEAICELPEYGLTRAEERLLRRHAEEIAARWPPPAVVAELGSGTGRKTRVLLEALAARREVVYSPIEISPAALANCRRELADLPSVRIRALEAEYLDGLAEVAETRPSEGGLLVLFLGSTIGNFDRPAMSSFLRRVRKLLRAGDALLLGADLDKAVDALVAAYDDPLGVTAAFNRNLLTRMQRELGADCDPRAFAHLALYREADRRIEMHLASTRDQRIRVPAAGLHVFVGEGETIWTESCHKFSLRDLHRLAFLSGFRSEGQWVDPEWPFAECLWVAD